MKGAKGEVYIKIPTQLHVVDRAYDLHEYHEYHVALSVCCKTQAGTRVLKNTYPVRTEHALQFRVLHVQWVPRLVAGVQLLHCMRQFAYNA